MAEQSETTQKAVKRLDRIMRAARTGIDPVVPIQIVQTFLAVAANEGKSTSEIAEIVGANVSTASRHLLDLGDRDRNKNPGYGLIERRVDPMELRRNNYFLTTKGKLVLDQLINALGG